MTDDTENSVDITDEQFEAEFFNADKAPKAPAKEPEVDENEDDSLAPDEDTEDTDDEAVEAEDEDGEEEVELPEEEEKPKQSRAQKRIESLLERERLANERERAANEKAHALEVRLAALEAKEVKPEAKATRETLPDGAPDFNAVGEDGEPLYPLGEFDPKFTADLTRFVYKQEADAAKVQAQEEAYAAQMNAAREEIRETWIDNLDAAEAEIPEIRENIRSLTTVFEGIDPHYGEYLASAIMSLDNGPQIMNYLSQNIGEAQRIVASGPHAATFELGMLAHQIGRPGVKEEKRNTKQVSKATPPPEVSSKGRKGQFAVAPDTDDLDAFEKAFFN